MRRGVYVVGLIAAWAFGARPVAAHEAPIPVTRMVLTADHGHLILHFHSDAPWWVLEVLGEATPPPTHWPNAITAPLKTYFDRHVIVRADGQTLPSTLTWGRYSEEVWRYYGGSRLDMTFEYPLPPQAQTISGDITLYKEDLAASSQGHTTLRFFGASPREVSPDLAHPTFSVPMAEITRTPAQQAGDQWRQGIEVWETLPWVVLLMVAMQLQLRTRLARGARWGLISLAAVLTGAVIAAKRALGPGYALGVLSILMVVAAGVEAALHAYHSRLVYASESQADRLFMTQTRFLSFLIGGIALLLFAETVAAPA